MDVRMTLPARRCLSLFALLLGAGCAQLDPSTGELADATAPTVASLTPVATAAVAETPVIATVPPPAEPVAPPPPRDIWERIRAGSTLPAMDSKRVRDWENYYASKPDYVAGMVERGSHYLFHIVEEVERRKMPAEIALLPMIESAYNPQAYSRAHASGLWQFIPSTGRLYGLRQNWWYDGRRDVIAATSAALDYLEKLYAQFGDWELALASYNWGEGAVARAVARNQARGLPADYASLTMPAETRNYLPKLIAVKNIIADPARFGIQLASVPNAPYFEAVTVKSHIDVKLAAKFAEMPLDEFKFLNPAHNKQVIKAYAETIVLPRDKVAVFNTNLENHDEPLVSWQAHTVRPGEKPEKIAAKYGMSVAELKQVNNINSRNRFRIGQPLLVPVKAGAEPNLPDLPATPVTLPQAYKAARSKNVKRSKAAARPVAKRAASKRKPAQRPKTPDKTTASDKPASTLVASGH
jgi:membrane-bound lytic murein transglycosylase D